MDAADRDTARPAIRPLPTGAAPMRWIAALDQLSAAQGRPFDPRAGTAEGVVCLDSPLLGHGLGRWTIAAACPLAEVRGSVRDVRLSTWDQGRWTETQAFDDPFEAVGALLAPHQALDTSPIAHLPFRGGALGLFGYGCRAAVEAIEPDHPRWGEPDVWWGLYDTFVAFDGEANQGWIVSWGLLHNTPNPALAAQRADALLDAIQRVDQGPTRAVTQKSDHTANQASNQDINILNHSGFTPLDFEAGLSRAGYVGAVGRILDAVARGRCYQACMTYPMEAARPPGVTARALFERLRAHAPAPFAALVVPGGPLAMASASPERFMAIDGGLVRVRPMKGTRPRGATPEEDGVLRAALLSSEKDRAENIMIVDLMRNDLGRVCALGSVAVPALFTVETYANVHQMTSTIQGRLRDDVPVTEAIRACFAPGSMTGAPKVAAMALLDALEIGPRGWYSGVLGHLGWDGDADLSVVIRTALVADAEVVWHVGGGIVADSTPEGEWRESLDKGPIALQRTRE